MMNSFLKTFLASLLAVVIGSVLFVMLGFMILAGIGAAFSSESAIEVKEHSILKIDLADAITDSPSGNPMGNFDFMSMTMKGSNSLLGVLNSIERAASDDKIDGIYLNVSSLSAVSLSSAAEIRDAINKFKESGKFVYSYADYYSQMGYYFSSVADKVFLNPAGAVDWQGMASGVMFFKGLLDKVGVEAEVIRHGQFKAAVEPFIMNSMSPENRLQTNVMLNSMWGVIVKSVADSRGIDTTLLQQYASNLALGSAQSVVELKMADSLLYYSDVEKMLAELTDCDEDKLPEFVSLSKYSKQPDTQKVSKLSKNKIALVYAEGSIIDQAAGSSASGSIVGNILAAKLAKLRTDDKVKAVVLRVNSPGGSALASEVIWNEVRMLREKKPVIVSMGEYAASGGYYISAPADAILASPLTLTGSIGVFGLMFNGEKGLKDKLGVNVDVVKTSKSADLGMAVMGVAGVRSLSSAEREFMQQHVERTYNVFVDHVATGRNLTVGAVDSIGGGRVWSGVNALQIGLIDGFGGIKDAIALAAERAGVADDYRIYTPNEEESPFEQVMSMLSAKTKAEVYQGEMGAVIKEYERLVNTLNQTGVQALLPFSYHIQ